MGVCAFCSSEEKLTDEHVWSAAVLKACSGFVPPNTLDHARGKAYVDTRGPVIKDLCARCNNIRTSPADAAAAAFVTEHLTGPIEPGGLVIPSPLVLRWVVKTAANHERVLGGPEWWRKHVPFILGDRAEPDPALGFHFAALPSETHGSDVVEPLAAQRFAGLLLAPAGAYSFRAYLEGGWALRVGSGIFVVLDWAGGDTAGSVRDRIEWAAREAGWSRLADAPVRVPFHVLQGLLDLAWLPTFCDWGSPRDLRSVVEM